MANDDSLVEGDDSFCDIYSTKSVTSTYNTILNKLKNTQATSLDPVDGNVEDSHAKNKDNKINDNVISNFNTINESTDEFVILDDSPVEECRPRRRVAGLRRSERIQNGIRSSRSKPRRGKKTAIKIRAEDIDLVDLTESGPSGDTLTEDLNDEINYEVSVKVIWKSVSIKTFTLRRFQRLAKIFDHFKEEENIPIGKIFLSLNDVKISPNDTPDSLNLKVYDFIEGGVLSDLSSFDNDKVIKEKISSNENSVTIKIQDSSKSLFKFSIYKCEPLKVIMIKYAEQIETPLSRIKFFFDGDIVRLSDTPESLGLENEEVLDVKICEE